MLVSGAVVLLSPCHFFFFFLPEKLTSLGTRRIFNEEHDALREVARNFFQTRVFPFHSKWEEEGQIPRQTWKEAGERGLLCMTMPGEYGGLGQDILSAAIGWCDCDFWFLFFFFLFVLFVQRRTLTRKDQRAFPWCWSRTT